MKESFLFFALYLSKKAVLEYVLRDGGVVRTTEDASSKGGFSASLQNRITEEARRLLFKFLSFQRYAMSLHLISLKPALAAATDSCGNTALHVACTRRKPEALFVSELLKRFGKEVPINAANSSGFTPLHLVALHGRSVSAKDVVNSLLSHGALEDTPAPNGATALNLAKSPYTREALSLNAKPQRRRIAPLDPAVKEQIDSCADVTTLPPLKIAEVEASPKKDVAPERPSSSFSSPAKKPKKLPPEAVEGLVTRLYSQSIQIHQRWMSDSLAKLDEDIKKRAKHLSEAECQETTTRLHDTEMQIRASKKEELMEKVLSQRPESMKLGQPEIEESLQRLFKGAVEARMKVQVELERTYSPPRERSVISKEQVAASAHRLHDECAAKTKEKFSKLHTKFLSKITGRFAGGTKLDADGWKKMGERLCQPKKVG